MGGDAQRGQLDCDVVVLGAGIAGLLSARRLVGMGYRVVVVDPAEQVMSGASSRNEGWLHAGTYHSMSIGDPVQAAVVAKRCIYGWEQLHRDFPECIEPEARPTLAIVREDQAERALQRWGAAGVGHRELDPSLRREFDEDVVTTDSERVFEVRDRSVNVRILGARLVNELLRAGATLLLGARPRRGEDGAIVLDGTHGLTVRHRLLVLATGFATGAVCRELGLAGPEIRLWQSHLAIMPRLSPMSVFSVAPREAAMANHGDWSVVGLNEDAYLVPEPTFVPRADGTDNLLRAIAERFRRSAPEQAKVTSCVKVDVRQQGDDARSLNIQVEWLDDTTLCVLPGKMTEAPFAADYVSHQVFARLHTDVVTRRPLEAHVDDLRGQAALV
ncbi:NAD(P)/FAD-dependent oxidoreductase [Pedococcus sp. 2YAF34]|uniref:NAD(P)/FAD-dependent oxidoreductase n=1 Tax=Pedococcus sp. 2YAF34 TaxID=3233032 RepID=UPI003F9C9E57